MRAPRPPKEENYEKQRKKLNFLEAFPMNFHGVTC